MSSTGGTPRRSSRRGTDTESVLNSTDDDILEPTPRSTTSSRRSSRINVQQTPVNQGDDPNADMSETESRMNASISSEEDQSVHESVDLAATPLKFGTDTESMASPRSEMSQLSFYRSEGGLGRDRPRVVQFGDESDTESRHAGGFSQSTTGTGGSTPRDAGSHRMFIWGTDICVADSQRDFREFLETFDAPDDEDTAGGNKTTSEEMDDSSQLSAPESDGVTPSKRGRRSRTSRQSQSTPARDEAPRDEYPYYLRRLRDVGALQHNFMNLNLQHLKPRYERLYRQIICYPTEIIPLLDGTATDLLEETFPNYQVKVQIMIRPFNALKTRNMRGLNPEDIDQIITISGMVIRTSNLIPETKSGFFECTICKNTKEVDVDRGRIEEPTLCTNCNTSHSFKLIHNRCQFSDKQMLKLQEAPEDMPAGQTPHTVSLYAHGELVDAVQPGDRVTVTGIFRAVPIRLNPRMRTVRAVYRTYIDVLHFHKKDEHRLYSAMDGSHLSKQRIEQITRLAQKSDVYERLSHAMAPSIFEHDDIKKGILCLLFGGTKKDFEAAGRKSFRSDINILLCGDPGTSKSQLLQYVHSLVPRGQYTSGKGSSAVGLTAYLAKDIDTKQLVLQTGALVLSDNGVCCIDEFDKMNDSTRSVLHEVMEQQTMSIAKAGIISTLNARTSILAAANPVDSEWNKNKTIIENVQLPHTLLSRFDLIFLMLDPQDEHYDRKLAAHLVSLYYSKTETVAEEEIVDLNLFRDYIQYAKLTCKPKLTEAASQNLIDKYVKMRQVGKARGQISAFPRQLESLIRLSEAHAKIRLSETVEEHDIEEAFKLHREALKQSATDPVTGLVDPGMLASGLNSSLRRQVAELAKVIKAKLDKLPYGCHVKNLLNDLRQDSDQMIRREIFDDAISELIRQDQIVRDARNRVKILFRAQGPSEDADSMAMG